MQHVFGSAKRWLCIYDPLLTPQLIDQTFKLAGSRQVMQVPERHKPSARPWLGYLMLLEEASTSTRPSKRKKLPHYPMREDFRGISYAQRYEIFCEWLVHERLYDATCFLMSSPKEGIEGKYVEPSAEFEFQKVRSITFSSRWCICKTQKLTSEGTKQVLQFEHPQPTPLILSVT